MIDFFESKNQEGRNMDWCSVASNAGVSAAVTFACGLLTYVLWPHGSLTFSLRRRLNVGHGILGEDVQVVDSKGSPINNLVIYQLTIKSGKWRDVSGLDMFARLKPRIKIPDFKLIKVTTARNDFTRFHIAICKDSSQDGLMMVAINGMKRDSVADFYLIGTSLSNNEEKGILFPGLMKDVTLSVEEGFEKNFDTVNFGKDNVPLFNVD